MQCRYIHILPSASCLRHAGCLLGLLFNLENGDSASVLKVSEILLEYMVLYHSRQHSSEVNLINHFSSISFPPRKSQLLLLQQAITFSNLTFQAAKNKRDMFVA
jgi:hypothetical protein